MRIIKQILNCCFTGAFCILKFMKIIINKNFIFYLYVMYFNQEKRYYIINIISSIIDIKIFSFIELI